MGSKSNYLENKLLDLIFGDVPADWARPTELDTLHFALFTGAPSDSGGGTEVTGGNYARAAVTNDVSAFAAASGGSKTNADVIVWPEATAGWGTVQAVGVFDAASGGNLLYWGTLSVSKLVENGDTFRLPIGAFTVTED